MATSANDISAATGNANVRKYLDMLAQAEGVKYGYATGFGNRPLATLDDHPRTQSKFTETTGKENSTSAAGRYQFLQKTWDGLKKQYPDQMPDFGADSQDFAATALLKNAGALDDVMNGNFTNAVKKTGAIWASLPSSTYKQNKRSWEDISGYLGQEVSGGGGGAPIADTPVKQNLSANLGAFKAYQSGAMSDPQQRKDFENDVYSGALQLPKAAVVKVGKPAQEVPIGAVVAFNQGKMTPQQSTDFLRDIDEGRILIPKGANLQRGAAPKPTSDTLLGDVGQSFKNLKSSIVGDGGFVDVFTAPTRTGFGAAEAIVGGGAHMAAMIPEGLYGIASGISNMLPKAIGGGGSSFGEGYTYGAQQVKNVAEKVIPPPLTKAGEAIQQIMGAPGAELHRGGQGAGAWVEDKTGSKVAGGLAASLFETAGNAAMMGLPLKGRAASQNAAAAARTRQQIIDSRQVRQPAPTPAPIPEPAPVRTPAERMDADIAAFQAERAAQQPLAGTPEGLAAQAETMNAPAPLPSPPPAIPEGYSLVDLGDGVMGVRRNPEPTPPPRPVIDEIATPIPEITRPDGKTYVLDDSLDLVHGSSKPDLSIDTLQITGRTDAKQSKRGRSFGGFYLTSKADEAQATGYANMGDGTPTLYDVRIKPDTKILEKTGDIMRLDDNYINQLVNDGYGLIIGKDVRGRTEYVVLDKNAVEGMAARSESTPAPLPVPPTPRPTPVPPVPPIPEPAPIPAPRPTPEVIPEVAADSAQPIRTPATTVPVELLDITRSRPIEGGVDSAMQQARHDVLKNIGLADGEIRAGAVSGDSRILGQERELAKADTEAGQAMQRQHDLEQQKLTDYGDNIVRDTGGTFGAESRQRGATIFNALDAYAEDFKASIGQAYKDAGDRVGSSGIPLTDFMSTLRDPANFKGGDGLSVRRDVLNTLRQRDLLNKDGSVKPINAKQAEEIRQSINESWDQMKPQSQRAVSTLVNALDDAVTKQLGVDEFAAARAKRKQYADIFENPKGLARVLDANGKDGINRSISFEKLGEKMKQLAETDSAQFEHIKKTLSNMPNEILQAAADKALGEIRAQIAEKITSAKTPAAIEKAYAPYKGSKIRQIFGEELANKLENYVAGVGVLRTIDKNASGTASMMRNLVDKATRGGAVAAGSTIGGVMSGGLGIAVGGLLGEAFAGRIKSHMLEAMDAKALDKSLNPKQFETMQRVYESKLNALGSTAEMRQAESLLNSNRPVPPRQISALSRRIEKLKQWSDVAKLLTPEQRATVKKVGVIAWLSQTGNEETK